MAGWGGLFISPIEKVAVGVKPSFLLLTGRCYRPNRTRLVVPTIEASALIGLGAESGHLPPDTFGRVCASLEPIGRCYLVHPVIHLWRLVTLKVLPR